MSSIAMRPLLCSWRRIASSAIGNPPATYGSALVSTFAVTRLRQGRAKPVLLPTFIVM